MSPTPSSTGSTSATTLSDHPIAARWRAIRGNAGARRAALIPYLTAGFPPPELSLQALRRVAAAGADFVEVGVPFSDPLADGPTIQRSTQTALDQGMTVPRVLDQVRRAALDIPVVVMTYLNPLLAFGLERFVREAAAAGVSGLILTDFPAGADPDLEATVRASPLALIRLVAPTTTPDRLARAVQGASGFLYLISRLGVTGVRDQVPADLAEHVARVRSASALPLAVVVGSAIVDALAVGGVGAAERLVRELAAAVREGTA